MKRRLTGEYETDDWGYDPEFLDRLSPFFTFMYKTYWRVQITRAGKRAGGRPGAAHRQPFGAVAVGWRDGRRGGLSGASRPAAGAHALRHLVPDPAFLLRDARPRWVRRWRLSRTARGCWRKINWWRSSRRATRGSASCSGSAIGWRASGGAASCGWRSHAGAPIIPVSVVGAEETYISLYKSPTIARLISFPYLPDLADVPVAGPAGLRAAAHQVVHRLRRADPHGAVRPGRRQ